LSGREQQVRCLASPKNLVGCGRPLHPRLRGVEADAQQFRADHIHNVDSDIADDLVKWRTKTPAPAPATPCRPSRERRRNS